MTQRFLWSYIDIFFRLFLRIISLSTACIFAQKMTAQIQHSFSTSDMLYYFMNWHQSTFGLPGCKVFEYIFHKDFPAGLKYLYSAPHIPGSANRTWIVQSKRRELCGHREILRQVFGKQFQSTYVRSLNMHLKRICYDSKERICSCELNSASTCSQDWRNCLFSESPRCRELCNEHSPSSFRQHP